MLFFCRFRISCSSCSSLSCTFSPGREEAQGLQHSSGASTWMPAWPCSVTSDLSESGSRHLSSASCPGVCQMFELTTCFSKQGRHDRAGHRREQNKESDFTDPLSIKHLRRTIAHGDADSHRNPSGFKARCARDFPAAEQGLVVDQQRCFLSFVAAWANPEDVAGTAVYLQILQ